MLEILKFIFGSFWVWLGTMGILYIIMIIVLGVMSGIVSCVKR